MTNIFLIIAAIAAVESGDNPKAYNAREDAAGALQIRSCVVADVNRVTGKGYTLQDRFDPTRCKQIACAYLQHYATRERLGREPTVQDVARIWNGGPNGHRKQCTTAYAEEVEAVFRSPQVAVP